MKNYSAIIFSLIVWPAFAAEFDVGVSFVVLGDTTYDRPADVPDFLELAEAINDMSPSVVIHVGDIGRSGTSDTNLIDACSDAGLTQALSEFEYIEPPLVYTPGDNEWTDCGSGERLERLKAVRRVFFSETQDLDRSLGIVRQTATGVPENARWSIEGVYFLTIHVVGTNNGRHTGESVYEHRNSRNLWWLQESFALAKEDGAKAMVVAFHGDIFNELGAIDGFADTRAALRKLGQLFEFPTLLVHGDSHRFILDRPFFFTEDGHQANEMYRLQTFGHPDAKAVKVVVNTERPGAFAFEPIFADDGRFSD